MAKTLEIHPAIGIARVGNSTEFFLGPEPGLAPPASRRDAAGRLKRQAARFRVYECERAADGSLTSFVELTPDKATITWEVHLANRKAAAPFFLTPNANTINTNPGVRRNAATGNADNAPDKDLIIDPGPRTLVGASQAAVTFGGGKFRGQEVVLGQMETDDQGRLVVVGGLGRAGSSPSVPINHFADNNNWFDDTSDGPVRATVAFTDGRPAQAVDRPAWLIACQPDYAPAVTNLVTLYDMIFDIAVQRGVRAMPADNPAFDRDIWPILERAMGYKWVNRFAHANHGEGGRGDFTSNFWKDLGDPTRGAPRRTRLFGLLRDPNDPGTEPDLPPMPMLFGDDYGTNPEGVLTLTRVQYRAMKLWSEGNFVTSSGGSGATDPMPDGLTRAALEGCAGGPFFPGIEAGRKLRDLAIYLDGEPFRFKPGALKPGELTQSMALPWQADFYACTWEDDSGRGWWPAQRPDDVLTAAAPDSPQSWVRGVNGWNEMVTEWHQLGIVVPQVGADGIERQLETERTLPG